MIHKHQHFDLLGKVVLERVIFTPPLRLQEQLDSETCLLYSVKGNSTLYTSSGQVALKSNNGALMKCGNYFNHWHINADKSQNEAVAIHLYPELIRYVYHDKLPDFLISTDKSVSNPVLLMDGNQLLPAYIESLLLYFNNPQIVDEEIILLKVKELLNLLYKSNSNNIRTLLHEMFNPSSYDLKQIVNNNIYEDLSLEELAHLCNLSLSSFKRKFRAIYDDAPASYIRNKRLAKASELLLVSNDHIAEIGFQCGFIDTDTFSKSFRKKYGVAPSEYRKMKLS